MAVGNVEVHTSSDGGHPPEFWAERIVARLMTVAETAPQPIRDQALAFRDQMKEVVLTGLKQAIESDRAYRRD